MGKGTVDQAHFRHPLPTLLPQHVPSLVVAAAKDVDVGLGRLQGKVRLGERQIFKEGTIGKIRGVVPQLPDRVVCIGG